MKKDTYSQVFEVADALLAEGVRPTQQQVRDRLGKGSLSTINKALNDWWQSIGQRLQQSQQYPELPEPLAKQMADWWRDAVDLSRREFELQKDRLARELKALKQEHAAQIAQMQQQAADLLKQNADQIALQQQLQQQLQEQGGDRVELERRVLDAERQSNDVERELKIAQAMIDRLSAEREQLVSQLAAPNNQIRQLEQENSNLKALVSKLDLRVAQAAKTER